MTWEQAPFNGGTVIIDYRVNIAVAGEAFSILASGLLLPEYKATGLTPGVQYEFKVESRNSYSYSDYSTTLSMLNAFKPEAPAAPVTSRTTNQMNIQWVEPFTNGSPITGYRIYILEHDGVTYT